MTKVLTSLDMDMDAEPRIFLHPGWVTARDGDRHFIGARQLAELYQVDYRKCFVVTTSESHGKRIQEKVTDIHLFPKSSGEYEMNTREIELRDVVKQHPINSSVRNQYVILEHCRNHPLRWAWFDFVRKFEWLPFWARRWPKYDLRKEI